MVRHSVGYCSVYVVSARIIGVSRCFSSESRRPLLRSPLNCDLKDRTTFEYMDSPQIRAERSTAAVGLHPEHVALAVVAHDNHGHVLARTQPGLHCLHGLSAPAGGEAPEVY